MSQKQLLNIGYQYAKALLSHDNEQNAATADFLAELEAILQDKQLGFVLSLSKVSNDNKVSLVSKLLGLEDAGLKKALGILIKNRRLSAVSYILRQFQIFMSEQAQLEYIKLEYSGDLQDETKEVLKQKIESMLGKSTQIEYSRNDGVIGGFRASSNSIMINASLGNFLNRLVTS